MAHSQTIHEVRQTVSEHLRDAFPIIMDKHLSEFLDASTEEQQLSLLAQQVPHCPPIALLISSQNRSRNVSNRATSFLSLSAEIRNNVYERILSDHTTVTIQAKPGGPAAGKDNAETVPPGSLTLLRLCRQVRNDVKPMFWGNKTFRVHIDMSKKPEKRLEQAIPAQDWLRKIGRSNAELVEKVELVAENARQGTQIVVSNKELLKWLGLEGLGLREEAIRLEERHCRRVTRYA